MIECRQIKPEIKIAVQKLQNTDIYTRTIFNNNNNNNDKRKKENGTYVLYVIVIIVCGPEKTAARRLK